MKKLKVGDIVKVTREKERKNSKITVEEMRLSTEGVITFAHPKGIFYVVEFRDKFTAEYKPMYRETFWPEQVMKIRRPKFFETRPAEKRLWAR